MAKRYASEANWEEATQCNAVMGWEVVSTEMKNVDIREMVYEFSWNKRYRVRNQRRVGK